MNVGHTLHISLLGVSLIPAYRNFIAIVDDEPDIAYLFKLALSDNGFDIMAFTDPVDISTRNLHIFAVDHIITS